MKKPKKCTLKVTGSNLNRQLNRKSSATKFLFSFIKIIVRLFNNYFWGIKERVQCKRAIKTYDKQINRKLHFAKRMFLDNRKLVTLCIQNLKVNKQKFLFCYFFFNLELNSNNSFFYYSYSSTIAWVRRSSCVNSKWFIKAFAEFIAIATELPELPRVPAHFQLLSMWLTIDTFNRSLLYWLIIERERHTQWTKCIECQWWTTCVTLNSN